MLLAVVAHCRLDLARAGELRPKRIELPVLGESLLCEREDSVYELLSFFFWSCSHT